MKKLTLITLAVDWSEKKLKVLSLPVLVRITRHQRSIETSDFNESSAYPHDPFQRMRVKWEKGSGFAFGAGLAASGTPKTFQNLSVSSPAAVATEQPSGL